MVSVESFRYAYFFKKKKKCFKYKSLKPRKNCKITPFQIAFFSRTILITSSHKNALFYYSLYIHIHCTHIYFDCPIIYYTGCPDNHDIFHRVCNKFRSCSRYGELNKKQRTVQFFWICVRTYVPTKLFINEQKVVYLYYS